MRSFWKRKPAVAIILAATMALTSIPAGTLPVAYAATTDQVKEDTTTLDALIQEGKDIVAGDGKSASAFLWITKVETLNEKYPASHVYNDIKSECAKAKTYDSVNLSGTADKIVTYLTALKAAGLATATPSPSPSVSPSAVPSPSVKPSASPAVQSDSVKSIDDLIAAGKVIAAGDGKSASAFLWLAKVEAENEKHTSSAVYNDIKSNCALAKNLSDVNSGNYANKITGYLELLKQSVMPSPTPASTATISPSPSPTVKPSATPDAGLQPVRDAINKGVVISSKNGSSTEAAAWLDDVNAVNKRHPNSFVYSSINSEFTAAKKLADVNTDGHSLKITGYLCYLYDEIAKASAKTIDDLITEGIKFANKQGASSYIPDYMVYYWEKNVSALNATRRNAFTYNDIVKACTRLETDSSWYAASYIHKITGYLSYLRDEDKGFQKPNVSALVTKGKEIVNKKTTDYTVYTWLMEVNRVNELNKSSNVYTKLSSECESAKASFTLEKAVNINNYLTSLRNEQTYTDTLQGISIVSAPVKVIYTAGENFDKTGMKANARYTRKYSDGSTEEIIKENIDFNVEIVGTLTTENNCCVISYTDNGIVKTAVQFITVSPRQESSILDKITIAKFPDKTVYTEGENFDSTGMKVNAIYKDMLASGKDEYRTVSDVKYTVSAVSNLVKGRKTITVYYSDGNVQKTASFEITVNAKPVIKTKVNKVTGVKVKSGKKKLTVSFNQQSGCKYQVEVSAKKGFTSATRKVTANNKITVKKLKSKKTYYIRVRAYKKANGKTVYGKWSNTVYKKTK